MHVDGMDDDDEEEYEKAASLGSEEDEVHEIGAAHPQAKKRHEASVFVAGTEVEYHGQ